MTLISSSRCPACHLCGKEGQPLYLSLGDRLFGTDGAWTLVQCPDPACALIWLDPMPLEEDIAHAYDQYYTHVDRLEKQDSWLLRLFLAAKRGYLARRYGYRRDEISMAQWLAGWLICLHPGRRAVLDFNVMWLHRKDGGRLLDIGCGSGEFLCFMRSLGWRAEGVDFDAQAAANAAAKGVQVHVGHLGEQHFAENMFDAVTMSHFIEHVHDPSRLIEECHRILRPGGVMVAVTPNTQSLGHHLYEDKWMHLDPPRHLHLFNVNSLRRLAERRGFSRLDIFTSLRDAYGMFIGSRSILRNGRHDFGGTPRPRERLQARAMELFEWLAMKRAATLGEELVLIARK